MVIEGVEGREVDRLQEATKAPAPALEHAHKGQLFHTLLGQKASSLPIGLGASKISSSGQKEKIFPALEGKKNTREEGKKGEKASLLCPALSIGPLSEKGHNLSVEEGDTALHGVRILRGKRGESPPLLLSLGVKEPLKGASLPGQKPHGRIPQKGHSATSVLVDTTLGRRGREGGETDKRLSLLTALRGSKKSEVLAQEGTLAEGEKGSSERLLETPLSLTKRVALPLHDTPQDSSGVTEKSFLARLDQILKEEGRNEIVKTMRVFMKEREEGEIRLVLKPESLGEVRVRLNVENNHIAGRILVENRGVRQVFMDNLSQLIHSLEDSGFRTASLDVSVGGRGGGGVPPRETPLVSDFAEAFEETVPVAVSLREEGVVNLVV